MCPGEPMTALPTPPAASDGDKDDWIGQLMLDKSEEDRVRPLIRAHVSAAVSEAVGALEAKLHAINLAVDGYVDGAPDAGPVAKLANEVSLIINPPDYP